jgi:hypothetical protein
MMGYEIFCFYLLGGREDRYNGHKKQPHEQLMADVADLADLADLAFSL